MNIIEIGQILAFANDREFYEDYEMETFKTTIIDKLKILLGDMFPVYSDSALEGLTHKEIAAKYKDEGINENNSKDIKRRAKIVLEKTKLPENVRKYMGLKVIPILLVMVFF